jgi:hypothetical protein
VQGKVKAVYHQVAPSSTVFSGTITAVTKSVHACHRVPAASAGSGSDEAIPYVPWRLLPLKDSGRQGRGSQ